ncbi:hypothetical protein [Paenibacillus piscarius]|uniref:hypothetical protein n=1 Tax=Paenibacillus piscarius TaxID=1089681 RepID=UPI001EE968C3|nr:hypothetical protein [Paenibacillus piscarius]
MSKKRLLEMFRTEEKYLDISNWPIVNKSALDPENQKLFERRELAVSLYMEQKLTNQEIKESTGIDEKEIRRLIKRCLIWDDSTNIIWGFRALIPQKRISNYERKQTTSSSKQQNTNFNGAFTKLMNDYPVIKEKITSAYLRKTGRKKEPHLVRGIDIHSYFLTLCKKIGLCETDYPFNTADGGKRALYRYFKVIESTHFSSTASLYGSEASRNSKRIDSQSNTQSLLLYRPYQRVQFDGHRIDAMFTITYKTPEGDWVTDTIERIWLLAIIDVATRTILGYHISLNKEYTQFDVLQCIKKAIMPYTKRTLTIDGLQYLPSGGFPSSVIPQTEWACWNEFSCDNAKANLSQMVRDRLYQVVDCRINPGPAGVPEFRGIIERFFRTLENRGYHNLVSTTGSHPKDPLRNNPEQAAKKFEISLEDLEELTDVLISDYNGTRHSGIDNFSPLELMKQRIEQRGMIPRTLEPLKRKDVVFFTLHLKRKIRGDVKKGKRPFIHYEGADYKSSVLSNSPALIGKELTLVINTDDLRVIRAFLADGSEFGYLTATGKWGVTPHSLVERKAINKLKANGEIYFNTYQNPMVIYDDYIKKRSIKNKRFRNQYAEILRKTREEERQLETQKYVGGLEQPSIVQEQASDKDVLKEQVVSNTIKKPLKTFNF